MMMLTTVSAYRNAAILRRTWTKATTVANGSNIIPSSAVVCLTLIPRSFSSNNNNNNGGSNNNNNFNMMTRPRRPSPRMGRSQQQNQNQQQQNRLRRPNPSSMIDSDSTNISGASPSSQFGLRHNAITILPGDFSDSYEPQWTDDDDDDDWKEDDVDSDDDSEVWSPELSPNGGNSDDEDNDDDTFSFGGMDSLTRAFAEKAQIDEANRTRWIANAQPPILHSIVDDRGRSYGRGGRKTATARAWIQPGCGYIVVNKLDFINYFIRAHDREHVLQPLVATDTVGLWDIQVMVRGGGLSGQAGAARLAISNALNAYNPLVFRPPLKQLGLLTRDARIVERKKVGHKKARKSPQWVRR